MTEPLRVPIALQVLAALALLLALNEVAPGIVPAVLLLVALYLVLSNAGPFTQLMSGAVDSLGRALQGKRYAPSAH